MNHGEVPAYGLWGLVIVNSAIFIIFAFSFFKPKSKRDWRTFGTFSAFLVALFVEMYGFPLSIYFLSGWLQSKLPGVDILSHDAGHLWYALLGLEGNPHWHPLHIAANVIIVFGFIFLSASWKVLWAAQRIGRVAMSGPYAYVRHPQYIAFISIMFGFLLMWPTLLTLVMFPILVVMYVRLAHREEQEVAAELGDAWRDYAARTPRWFPNLGATGRLIPFFKAGEQKGGNRDDRSIAKSARSVGSTTQDQDSLDLTAGRHQNSQGGGVSGPRGAGRGG